MRVGCATNSTVERTLALIVGTFCLAYLAGHASFASSATALEPLPFIRAWGVVGSDEGQFQDALTLSVGLTGDVYVSDYGNNRIQEFTSTGSFVRAWTVPGPWGVAVAMDGSVYVCTDYAIHRYSSTGVHELSWGSVGIAPGQLHFVQDIAVDSDENVYAADLANHRIQKFDSNGSFVRAWPVGYPKGIAVGSDGSVYVTDAANITIQKFTSDGDFITSWDLPGGIPGDSNRLGRPAIDAEGNVYLPDCYHHSIAVFTGEGALLTAWGSYGTAEGQFRFPKCAALSATGELYVMDYYNNRVQEFGRVITDVATVQGGEPLTTLGQPAPNPMREDMRVQFALPRDGRADLSVFDVQGRLVAHILEGHQRAGGQEVTWAGRDHDGRPVASGIYFLRLNAAQSLCRRFVVLR